MKIIGYVYKIVNTLNGKLYIGVTKCSLAKRWREHKCRSQDLTNKKHLYLAIRKYGFDNFRIELIKTCYSDYQLYNSEIYFIRMYDTTNRFLGYNNSTGGEQSNLGMKHSEETKKRISEVQKGNKKTNSGSFKKGHKPVITENSRRMISERMKNRVVSEETKQKISKTLTGRKTGRTMPDWVKQKMSLIHKGSKRSPEFMKKIGDANPNHTWSKDFKMSQEQKDKISAAKKGVKQSQETKDKRSKSIKESWNKRKGLC